MNDRAFEDQLSGLFLQPTQTTDCSHLVAPIMRRIETEDRRRGLALGASAVVGAAMALAAVDLFGAAQPVRTLAAGLWAVATALPQTPPPGLWTLIPLAAVGLGLSALAATRAAQQL